MTVGPTATQLHKRTLTEEEEPRTAHEAAAVPAIAPPSSSASACDYVYRTTPTEFVCIRCGYVWQPHVQPIDRPVNPPEASPEGDIRPPR